MDRKALKWVGWYLLGIGFVAAIIGLEVALSYIFSVWIMIGSMWAVGIITGAVAVYSFAKNGVFE